MPLSMSLIIIVVSSATGALQIAISESMHAACNPCTRMGQVVPREVLTHTSCLDRIDQ